MKKLSIYMRKVGKGLLAIAMAVFAMDVTARIFDTMGLPVLHSWGVAQGMLFIAVPLYSMLFYRVLGKLYRSVIREARE